MNVVKSMNLSDQYVPGHCKWSFGMGTGKPINLSNQYVPPGNFKCCFDMGAEMELLSYTLPCGNTDI